MRQSKYLNMILTVNAFLLAGLLWTQVVGGPSFVPEAMAQKRSFGPQVPNVPNAGQQRADIAKSIQKLNESVQAMKRLLESGRIQVQVTNLDEIPTN